MAEAQEGSLFKPRRDVIYGITDRRNDSFLVKLNDYLIDHGRISRKEKGLLFHSLELLVGSGVRFTRAVAMISKRTSNIRLARVLNTIHYDMEKNGLSFSSAMEKYPGVFSRSETRMIRSGELTGKIEETLESVSEQIQRNIFLEMEIRKALMYPISVIVALILAMIVSLVFIIPKFMSFFGEFEGASLPWPTQVVVTASDIFIEYWWVVIALAVGLIGLFKNWKNSDEGKRSWHRILLNIPNIKGLIRNIQTFRITTHLSVLIASGIDVSKSLKILGEIIPNSIISDAIFRIEEKVSTGTKMSQAFFDEPDLDPVLGEVLEVGEQTGKISEGLKKMAPQYQMEVESQLKNLTALIEPFTIILVAASVGFMALAILLPIFKIQELMTTL